MQRFYEMTISLLLTGILASLPYVIARTWRGEHSTILIMCLNGSKLLYNSTLHNSPNEPSIYAFFGSYYIIFSITILIDIVCYFQIMMYIRKNATQVAVISVTQAERKKARNVITAPANLLICLISLAFVTPAIILHTKFLLTSFGKYEDNLGLEGYHYATALCLSTIVPLLTIGSSGDLRQDIDSLKEKCLHKCNGKTAENSYEIRDARSNNNELANNIEMSLGPNTLGVERAGIYAIAGNEADYSS